MKDQRLGGDSSDDEREDEGSDVDGEGAVGGGGNSWMDLAAELDDEAAVAWGRAPAARKAEGQRRSDGHLSPQPGGGAGDGMQLALLSPRSEGASARGGGGAGDAGRAAQRRISLNGKLGLREGGLLSKQTSMRVPLEAAPASRWAALAAAARQAWDRVRGGQQAQWREQLRAEFAGQDVQRSGLVTPAVALRVVGCLTAAGALPAAAAAELEQRATARCAHGRLTLPALTACVAEMIARDPSLQLLLSPASAGGGAGGAAAESLPAEASAYVISPNSAGVRWWEAFVMLVGAWHFLEVPFRISYDVVQDLGLRYLIPNQARPPRLPSLRHAVAAPAWAPSSAHRDGTDCASSLLPPGRTSLTCSRSSRARRV